MRYDVRSVESRGHWRNNRWWGPEYESVDETEVSDTMRNDPRLEIHEVEEAPIGLREMKRRKRR